MNGTTLLAAALPGLLALAGVIYVRRDSRYVEGRKADADAFDRARTIDSNAIKRLQDELAREREDRTRERDEFRREIDRLERQIKALRERDRQGPWYLRRAVLGMLTASARCLCVGSRNRTGAA